MIVELRLRHMLTYRRYNVELLYRHSHLGPHRSTHSSTGHLNIFL